MSLLLIEKSWILFLLTLFFFHSIEAVPTTIRNSNSGRDATNTDWIIFWICLGIVFSIWFMLMLYICQDGCFSKDLQEWQEFHELGINKIGSPNYSVSSLSSPRFSHGTTQYSRASSTRGAKSPINSSPRSQGPRALSPRTTKQIIGVQNHGAQYFKDKIPTRGEQYYYPRAKTEIINKSPQQHSYPEVIQRLENSGFMLSVETPADGNCIPHALLDQMRYDPALAKKINKENLNDQNLREKICTTVYAADFDIRKVLLPSEDNNTSDEADVVQGWIDKMMQNGHWCDHVFLQLASNYLNKDFVILPINPEDGHNGTDRIVIKAKSSIGEPFYFLHYSSNTLHFQSIRPKLDANAWGSSGPNYIHKISENKRKNAYNLRL